jgi:hypothetical protein
MFMTFNHISSINIVLFSGSSTGDLGDVTPCNASPNLSALMAFRPIARDDTEELWRLQIQSLLNQIPASPIELFQLLHRLIKVCIVFNLINCLLNHLTWKLSLLDIKLFGSISCNKRLPLPLFCIMFCFFTNKINLG